MVTSPTEGVPDAIGRITLDVDRDIWDAAELVACGASSNLRPSIGGREGAGGGAGQGGAGAHASRVDTLAMAHGPVPLMKTHGRVVGMRLLRPRSVVSPSGEKASGSKTKCRWQSS